MRKEQKKMIEDARDVFVDMIIMGDVIPVKITKKEALFLISGWADQLCVADIGLGKIILQSR